MKGGGEVKTYQFTCAIRIDAPDTPWDGDLYVIPGLLTPPVKSDSRGEAMKRIAKEHPTIDWDESVDPESRTEYVIYEEVRSY